jgi:hypothetical protein
MDERPRELILSVPMWLGLGLDLVGTAPSFQLAIVIDPPKNRGGRRGACLASAASISAFQ